MIRRFQFLTLAVGFTLTSGLLMANTVTVSTAAGATNGAGDPVDASGTFTTGAGTVTIDLSNLLTATQMLNVGQDLSDVFFTLDTTTSSGSVSSSTGTFIDVGAGGVVTSASSGLAGPDLIGWGLSNTGGTYHLNGLGGGATPANTIIGGTPGSFTAYSSANNSIDSNSPHNPFVQGTGHFVLSIAGVTAGTNISDVVFSFGTTAGDNVSPVPEPGFNVLLLFAGITASAFAYRRRSRIA
jgi:hypothetical protein